MADVRACVFALSERLFAIDLGRVRGVRQFDEHTKVPRAPAHLIGVINVHGSIVPLLDSRVLLGLPTQGSGRPTLAVVLAWESMQVAITVDHVLGLQVLDANACPGAGVELLDVSEIVRSLAPGERSQQ
jgi:purine-binding chemotaxis protein CheW